MKFIDFPLLRTFEVSSSIVDFLNRKYDEYKKDHKSSNNYTSFSNERVDSGYQTDNLLKWEDQEYKEFINTQLLEIISNQLLIPKRKLSYHWNHMLEYVDGGEMEYHNHFHNEDFVLFIYLSSCDTGNTVFHLNHYNEEYAKRTTIALKPKRNMGAIFSSLIVHKGEYTKENKKIYVVGIRVDTQEE